ncbi:DUF2922 domain-containing protein [Clostridium cellulovorans]|uniref:DUF2922 domain-containing protein n=1 Tax=Clostridium cellulovorans (strain ATCC 35296 / DSM 3052 / OCM 3 / 743B) TaxID=573061 RepID=D9SUE8_CLOC7|nr:DUF2922 domain-containing protein [Clostridium cellulovorans]ADL52903.1 Protein of unknown function DUF2922 [Clostridium cellulovorans 743B]
MEFSLIMTFLTASGEKINMTISDVKPNLAEPEISSLMDVIIAKNIFLNNGNTLTGKAGAQIAQKQTTKIALQ